MLTRLLNLISGLFSRLDTVEYLMVVKNGKDITVLNPQTKTVATDYDAIEIVIEWYWNFHETDLAEGTYHIMYDPNTSEVISCEPATAAA